MLSSNNEIKTGSLPIGKPIHMSYMKLCFTTSSFRNMILFHSYLKTDTHDRRNINHNQKVSFIARSKQQWSIIFCCKPVSLSLSSNLLLQWNPKHDVNKQSSFISFSNKTWIQPIDIMLKLTLLLTRWHTFKACFVCMSPITQQSSTIHPQLTPLLKPRYAHNVCPNLPTLDSHLDSKHSLLQRSTTNMFSAGRQKDREYTRLMSFSLLVGNVLLSCIQLNAERNFRGEYYELLMTNHTFHDQA